MLLVDLEIGAVMDEASMLVGEVIDDRCTVVVVNLAQLGIGM